MKLADRRPLASPRKQIGMTLIEMLVVLAIIAIATTTAALSLGSGRGLDSQAEASRLTARLQLAADQTMISDGIIALALEQHGYSFVAWNATRGEWIRESSPALGDRHLLPSGLILRSDDSRNPLPLGAEASGRAFALTLSDDERSWRVEFDGMTARLAAGQSAAAARTGL